MPRLLHLVSLVMLVSGPTWCWGQLPVPLADQARTVLQKHCFDCHGKDPARPKGDLNLFDHSQLEDKERKIVVARAPNESELVKQIEQELMPPGKRPKVDAAGRQVLRDWIAAGAPAWSGDAVAGGADLAGQVKEIFRGRCLDCHGGSRTNAGVKILDHALLTTKKKVVPGKPEDSPLFQAISAEDESVMPPAGQARLSAAEIDSVRRWIASGAPPFPADVAAPAEPAKDAIFRDVAGVDYVLKQILTHVRGLRSEDRPFVRYFSINHTLTAGATAAQLELHRQALAKAINHLSWENRLVRPQTIDAPANTVFAIDLRELGWHRQPFTAQAGGKRQSLNLFDLALLEYPFGVVYPDSDTFDRLAEEYLQPAGMVRPVPFVRADWFVSVITQPPLYEDFLRLPFELKELEAMLGVDAAADLASATARRAGLTVSGVSRNNRVVERHPARYGAYWKSFDFRSSRGAENMFKDPIQLHPSGGEMIFHLPNGLQGYFVCDAKGVRVAAAPTDIVTDKFAEDKTVRNGLACMRCHDRGMKDFTDTVRPALLRLPGMTGFDKRMALELYPEQKDMDWLLQEDSARFLGAMEKALGQPQLREPLVPVTHQYLDAPLQLTTAAGELGLSSAAGLEPVFRAPQFTALGLMPLTAQGVVRRDAWEDYYDQVLRGLGLGVPVVPLDGESRRDFPAGAAPFTVELKTNKANNLFEPGDELVITVVNSSSRPLYIELIGTSSRGRKVVLASSDTVVAASQSYHYPPPGQAPIRIRGGLGKEQITLFASDRPFPAGVLLRGEGAADRVVHPFYQLERHGGRLRLGSEPEPLVKKTIDIETR